LAGRFRPPRHYYPTGRYRPPRHYYPTGRHPVAGRWAGAGGLTEGSYRQLMLLKVKRRMAQIFK
jgi:hypothetical protein